MEKEAAGIILIHENAFLSASSPTGAGGWKPIRPHGLEKRHDAGSLAKPVGLGFSLSCYCEAYKTLCVFYCYKKISYKFISLNNTHLFITSQFYRSGIQEGLAGLCSG